MVSVPSGDHVTVVPGDGPAMVHCIMGLHLSRIKACNAVGAQPMLAP